jgi:ankyrin repeat protein
MKSSTESSDTTSIAETSSPELGAPDSNTVKTFFDIIHAENDNSYLAYGKLNLLLQQYPSLANAFKADEGETALTLAALHNKPNFVELLLINGANVNNRNKSTWTPFIIAARNNFQTIQQILIKHGAIVLLEHDFSEREKMSCARSQQDCDSFKLAKNIKTSALDWAIAEGHEETVICILKQYLLLFKHFWNKQSFTQLAHKQLESAKALLAVALEKARTEHDDALDELTESEVKDYSSMQELIIDHTAKTMEKIEKIKRIIKTFKQFVVCLKEQTIQAHRNT